MSYMVSSVVNGFKSAFQSYRWRQDMLGRAIVEIDRVIAEESAKHREATGDDDATQIKRDRRGTSQKIEDRRRVSSAEIPAVRVPHNS